ncbi:hypothetical protein [Thalassotalea crassostreae]|uniref:hypothetical protein n=1 Tax=Thalassotalea crassostreae TaxID=1763536 RepID=UPI000838B520|nr:hypothetical protein [Thalassotalea crassostreae]
MPYQRIQLNNQQLSVWLEEDNGIVFSNQTKSLLKLSPLSIALLFAFDEGLTFELAIKQVQDVSGLPSDQISAAAKQIKLLFTEQSDQQQKTYADGKYPELKPHNKQKNPQTGFVVQVTNSLFCITSDCDFLHNELTKLLQPIILSSQEVSSNDTSSDTSSKNKGANSPNLANPEIDFVLHIMVFDEGYALISNGLTVEEGLTQLQLVPILIDRLQILAYQQSDYCFGFHGAALVNNQPTQERNEHNPKLATTILLPGVSGAGKSTLASELSTKGYALYSDEIIAFDDNFKLLPLALPMAIKQGSWAHIAMLYPQLTEQTEWHRVDGRILKYIWPQQIAKITKAEQVQTDTKTLMLCPRFDAMANGSSEPLSVMATLELITHGGYQLGIELTADKAEQLIRFCEHIHTEKLVYANSEQSHSLIDKIINSHE